MPPKKRASNAHENGVDSPAKKVATEKKVDFKLKYFALQGLAEQIRLVLEHAGASYEYITQDFTKWEAEKEHAPLGQLPVLTAVNHRKPEKSVDIAQSSAIVRYLAHRLGLAGETPEDQALLDMFHESLNEIRAEHTFKVYKVADDLKEANKLAYLETAIPKFINLMEKKIGAENETFLGGKITYMDIVLYDFMRSQNNNYPNAFSESLSPNMWRVYSNVNESQRIKEYNASDRPKPAKWAPPPKVEEAEEKKE